MLDVFWCDWRRSGIWLWVVWFCWRDDYCVYRFRVGWFLCCCGLIVVWLCCFYVIGLWWRYVFWVGCLVVLVIWLLCWLGWWVWRGWGLCFYGCSVWFDGWGVDVGCIFWIWLLLVGWVLFIFVGLDGRVLGVGWFFCMFGMWIFFGLFEWFFIGVVLFLVFWWCFCLFLWCDWICSMNRCWMFWLLCVCVVGDLGRFFWLVCVVWRCWFWLFFVWFVFGFWWCL